MRRNASDAGRAAGPEAAVRPHRGGCDGHRRRSRLNDDAVIDLQPANDSTRSEVQHALLRGGRDGIRPSHD